MARIVYESDDEVVERTVRELRYKEDTDCWWFYVDEDDSEGGVARYIPRERVYYVERGR